MTREGAWSTPSESLFLLLKRARYDQEGLTTSKAGDYTNLV